VCNATNPILYAAVAGTQQSPAMNQNTTAQSSPTGSVMVFATSGQTIDVRLNVASGAIQSSAVNGLTIHKVH